MTYLSQDGGARPPPAIFSRQFLDRQIARRRACLAALETDMIAACEAAALGSGARADPTDWGRATWHRYLAAAMRLECDYGPRMRRLRQEIGQLERLMTLPIAA
jgi:hypothetical protein